jgi:hypothetical protein
LIFLAGICGSRSPDLCNNFSPVLSWSPDLVLISVFVSVEAARFRFTRSLLLVIIPCWTGFDLFLSSRREQAQTAGEEPELPSSFSAAVPFTGQVPFALLLRGSRLVLLLSLGSSLHLCHSVDQAVFFSPACPVSDFLRRLSALRFHFSFGRSSRSSALCRVSSVFCYSVLPPAWCCVFTAAVFSC